MIQWKQNMQNDTKPTITKLGREGGGGGGVRKEIPLQVENITMVDPYLDMETCLQIISPLDSFLLRLSQSNGRQWLPLNPP